MEALLSRYRNLTILVVLILAQLLLLAYQVKTGGEIRLLRIWAVTAVTPVARLMEGARSNTRETVGDIFNTHNVREENEKLRTELGQAKVRLQFLENQLRDAEIAKALAIFQTQTPSRTLAARIIGTGAGLNSRVYYLDRGTRDGVERGMAVIVPEGIAGKIVASFPSASMLMLASEPTFVASVVSQKNRVRGTLKGRGSSTLVVENLSNLQKLEDGEWFFTSGEDRIFPRGFRVGVCKLIKEGNVTRGVELTLSGLREDPQSVLIVVGGAHALIPPPDQPPSTEVSILPAPPLEGTEASEAVPLPAEGVRTEADRVLQKYRNRVAPPPKPAETKPPGNQP